MNRKALIAMSGGVDSSVCAALILDKYKLDAVGATMKLFKDKADTDFIDAKKVCDKLGIMHYVYDLSQEFDKYVCRYFVKSYLDGETPNPCVECNRHLKFDCLLKKADELDCKYIATGHYAQIEHFKNTDKYVLKKAVDAKKDQSYFLYMLTQEQLSRTIFPLGEYNKEAIREIAQAKGFEVSHKPDSQDICFISNDHYTQYIEAYTGEKLKEGDFTLKDGTIIGKHKGFAAYTPGQRKGLGIAYSHPLYVCSKDVKNNRVILGGAEEIYSKSCIVRDFYSSVCDFSKPTRIKAKIRYRHPEQSAIAVLIDNNKLHIEFEQPQKAIAPGQSAVLYDGDYVIGGGIIEPFSLQD